VVPYQETIIEPEVIIESETTQSPELDDNADGMRSKKPRNTPLPNYQSSNNQILLVLGVLPEVSS
jgi:hypothetical protein